MAQFLVTVALASVLLAQDTSNKDVEPRHGKELVKWCANYPNNPQTSLCDLYVGSSQELLEKDGDFFGKRACPPAGISRKQIVDASLGWLRQDAARQELGAKDIVAGALAERYPCK
ncbi:MAG: Rap1a/Tai family immunity protein [Alphaproteobacteria bacterium]|nr:Rap1a/Tai family immunity protein [Alphaproteobacteria bacterium]